MARAKFLLNKLVRDLIVEKSEQLWIKVEYTRLELFKDIVIAKKVKVKEEVDELVRTEDTEKLRKEIIDAQAALDALRQEIWMSAEELAEWMEKKKQESGSFEQNLYVRTMEMDEENPRCAYYRKDPNRFPEIK